MKCEQCQWLSSNRITVKPNPNDKTPNKTEICGYCRRCLWGSIIFGASNNYYNFSQHFGVVNIKSLACPAFVNNKNK